MPPVRRNGSSAQPDRFTVWFFRAVQIMGLALIVYEALAADKDRPYLLLVASAMMLGSVGMNMILRWLIDRSGGTE